MKSLVYSYSEHYKVLLNIIIHVHMWKLIYSSYPELSDKCYIEVKVNTNDLLRNRRCFFTHRADHLMKHGFGYCMVMQQGDERWREAGWEQKKNRGVISKGECSQSLCNDPMLRKKGRSPKKHRKVQDEEWGMGLKLCQVGQHQSVKPSVQKSHQPNLRAWLFMCVHVCGVLPWENVPE